MLDILGVMKCKFIYWYSLSIFFCKTLMLLYNAPMCRSTITTLDDETIIVPTCVVDCTPKEYPMPMKGGIGC